MNYKVVFSPKTKKQLKKMDKNTQKIIMSWIMKNLYNTSNPRFYGKKLVGREGWRYRIGNYRVICEIKDKEIVILILAVAHRKNIYEK